MREPRHHGRRFVGEPRVGGKSWHVVERTGSVKGVVWVVGVVWVIGVVWEIGVVQEAAVVWVIGVV